MKELYFRAIRGWIEVALKGLHLDEVLVVAVTGHERVVGALLDDVAILHHADEVGVLDGAQAVSDD